MNNRVIASIDIGGTSISLALLDETGIRLEDKIDTHSQRGGEDVIVRLLQALRRLIERGVSLDLVAQAVGVACPGVLDATHQVVAYSPNLNWHNVPLVEILHRHFDLPVYMENDANLYALGEYAFGAGQGQRDLICFTLGTGVGSGIIINGCIVSGQSGWSGELGHSIVWPNGRRCGCGTHGCLEAYASATGLRGMLNEALAAGAASSMLKKDTGIKQMYKAARQRDALAVAIFAEAGRCLGLGIINAVLASGIEMIVLGGGVANCWSLMHEAAWRQIEKSLTIIDWRKLSIETSQLGDRAPLQGAAVLAGQHLSHK